MINPSVFCALWPSLPKLWFFHQEELIPGLIYICQIVRKTICDAKDWLLGQKKYVQKSAFYWQILGHNLTALTYFIHWTCIIYCWFVEWNMLNEAKIEIASKNCTSPLPLHLKDLVLWLFLVYLVCSMIPMIHYVCNWIQSWGNFHQKTDSSETYRCVWLFSSKSQLCS